MALGKASLGFENGGVRIRPLVAADEEAFLALSGASRDFHGDWLPPPTDSAAFGALLKRGSDFDFRALVVLEGAEQRLAGLICLSQIFRGAFQSAYSSYWLGAGFTGRGLMTEAMGLVLHYCFRELRLHRLEANIQPGNRPSIALVKRLGFVLEGYSEKYLQIQGSWRDHERWAIHEEIWPERDQGAEGWPSWHP